MKMTMIPTDVRTEIMSRLAKAEEEHGVRILFAIESGSRAWGFPSPNSDYDVRFIYMHEPEWYQAVDLEERRDVIEYAITDEIDLNGWDLRKALRLYWKSNPAFVEWLQSPITYLERGAFRTSAVTMLPEIYSIEKGIYHYRSIAKANYRDYLCEPQVRLKKYFYTLRALLASRWVVKTGSVAPIEFERLLVQLEDEPEVLAEVHKLLKLKLRSPELGRAPAIPVLNEFIAAELGVELATTTRGPMSQPVINLLNQLFRTTLQEYEA